MIGAVLFVSVLSGVDDRHQVLVVARPVPAGGVITSDDLRPVRVGAEAGVAFVSAAAKTRLVGRTAATALVAGALLAPDHIGASEGLAAGEAAVGLALAPGRFPPGLAVGDHVTVVSAPSGPNTGDGTAAGLGHGVVESLETTVDGNSTLIRLRLTQETAATVAAEGAANRLAVFLVAPGDSK